MELIIIILLKYGIVQILHNYNRILERILNKIWYIILLVLYNRILILILCLDSSLRLLSFYIMIRIKLDLAKRKGNWNYMRIILIEELYLGI